MTGLTITAVDYTSKIQFALDHSAGFIDAMLEGFKALAPYGLGLMVVVAALFWLIGIARRFIGSAS